MLHKSSALTTKGEYFFKKIPRSPLRAEMVYGVGWSGQDGPISPVDAPHSHPSPDKIRKGRV